jgi:hypothetical protein
MEQSCRYAGLLERRFLSSKHPFDAFPPSDVGIYFSSLDFGVKDDSSILVISSWKSPRGTLGKGWQGWFFGTLQPSAFCLLPITFHIFSFSHVQSCHGLRWEHGIKRGPPLDFLAQVPLLLRGRGKRHHGRESGLGGQHWGGN